MTSGATDQFRIIAENVDDVVYFSDPNRQIVWISPSASSQLGWDPEDLRGHRMSELIHLDDYRAVSESRRLLYSGTTVENPANGFVVRVRRRDDTWRWMSARSTVCSRTCPMVSIFVAPLTPSLKSKSYLRKPSAITSCK